LIGPYKILSNSSFSRTNNSSAIVANGLQILSSARTPWQLRWKPVCASTEIELARWLEEKPSLANYPRAIIAARQNNGKGQRGRYWESPIGGVWLSASLPCVTENKSAGLLGLAMALSLAERLEMLNIPVKIKWPNDLLVFRRKLAGLLPRIIYRGGTPRLACIGIGMNVFNPVPVGGIALAEILNSKCFSLAHWTVQVLLSLESAMEFSNENNTLCSQVEQRLWADEVIDPHTGETWLVEGLDSNGGLKLKRGSEKVIWTRW
tara:strand:- start:194 stop:982 length:789 start_codon:yes stop_codon:yes gene_type:complete